MKKELKYGNSDTYTYKMDEEDLKWITSKTNRSVNQTEFLFQLVNGVYYKLERLEENIKNCHIAYCPNTKEKVLEILNMKPKKKWFSLKRKKILVFGNGHGRDYWKEVVENVDIYDEIVFIGDYLDSFDIKPVDIIRNLMEIIEFKKEHPNKVTLL